MWEICAQGGMFASCIWILSNIGFLRLWSEMIVLVMLIMNDHNHVNGDYHIVKMITSIIMLRTMIMTVIGNALECLAAVCLLALASIVFLATSLLYSWFCISALGRFWKHGFCNHCFQIVSVLLRFCIFACQIVAVHKWDVTLARFVVLPLLSLSNHPAYI